MKVTAIHLTHIRGFAECGMHLSPSVNILVGPNNSGKTTILKSLLLPQRNNELTSSDLRMRQSNGLVRLHFSGSENQYFNRENIVKFHKEFPGCKRLIFNRGMTKTEFSGAIPSVEPGNFIYPYLSKRKVVTFREEIKLQHATAVSGNFENLYPKIDRISNPQFQPAYDEYIKACDEILGFRITCTASPGGKKAAYIVNNLEHISLDAMGEGVANLLGLIVDLCIAENKLFLIEEPENDIHPKALKSLLKLIQSKSEKNQFVITTHSNIVTKYLGAQSKSKIFNVSMKFEDNIPTSSVKEITDSPEARRAVLEELGYELYDVGVWAGWLILEESSAEKIIREYLIPWFVPNLQKKLRTFSARSISEVEIKFNDLNNLFVFLHLTPSYKNRAWVIVDHGECENKIINKMRELYAKSGWEEEHFQQFSEHDFENYYPAEFKEETEEILKIEGKQEKRDRKKTLLDEVEKWISEDLEKAKAAFKESAKEVIGKLKTINKSL